MRTSITILALGLALTLPAAAKDGPEQVAKPRFGSKQLTRRFAEKLQPTLEKVLNTRFKKAVPFKKVTVDAIAKVVERENIQLLGKIEGGPRGKELADASAQIGKTLAPMLLGKVDLETGGVLIVPEAFSNLAAVHASRRKILSQPFLDVVLLHEAVHAYQHTHHDLHTFMGQPRSVGVIKSRMAVLEGQAQWVTRRAAKRLGLERAFKLFLRVNSELPPIEDPIARLQAQGMVAQLSFPYVEGEKLFAHVAKALGQAEAMKRLFTRPPATMRAVSRPAEYLAPPTDRFDMGALAKRLTKLFGEGFRTQAIPLPENALRQGLVTVDPKRRDAVLKAFQGSSALVSVPIGQDAQIILVVYRFETPEAARAFAGLNEQVIRGKDEMLKRSTIKLLKADYTRLTPKTLWVEKAIQIPGRAEPVLVESLVRDEARCCLEVTFSNYPVGKKAALALIEAALKARDPKASLKTIRLVRSKATSVKAGLKKQ